MSIDVKKSIKESIKEFIRNNFVHENGMEKIDDDISLYEKGIVDSTGILELVDFLEETFNIRIEDDELIPDNLDSIEKITRFIEGKLRNVNP